MKPMNIVRAQKLLDSLSPKAVRAWTKVWEEPSKELRNLKVASNTLTDEELEMHFERWYEVMLEDVADRKLADKFKKSEKPFIPRSQPEEVKNHVVELYVIVREVLKRYYAGRLHVDAGLLARSGGPKGVKRAVGYKGPDPG